jgi:hypothetical protein
MTVMVMVASVPVYMSLVWELLLNIPVLQVMVPLMPLLLVALLAVLKVNLHVMMVHAYLVAGNVMYTIVTVLDAKMRPIVVLHLVPIKDYGIVVMDSVFQVVMYVMDQLIPVMQVGVLTVPMAQMKA